MSANNGYVHPEVLVDTVWVEDHVKDPRVRIIEVDVDTSVYDQEGHIPGAIGFNWKKDLQDQVVRAPLIKDQLEELLGQAGVSNETTIVLYGDNNNWFAAWAFWILKFYGHKDVCLLNGGRVKWLAEKREITTAVPSYPHERYHARATNTEIRALRDQILSRLGHEDMVLYVPLVNTVESYWLLHIYHRKEHNEVVIFLVQRTFPGQWRYVKMVPLNRQMNYVPSIKQWASLPTKKS